MSKCAWAEDGSFLCTEVPKCPFLNQEKAKVAELEAERAELLSNEAQWAERAFKMQGIINDYGLPCGMLPVWTKKAERNNLKAKVAELEAETQRLRDREYELQKELKKTGDKLSSLRHRRDDFRDRAERSEAKVAELEVEYQYAMSAFSRIAGTCHYMMQDDKPKNECLKIIQDISREAQQENENE